MILETRKGESGEEVLKSAAFVGCWEVRTVADATWTSAINETGLPRFLKTIDYENERPTLLQNVKRMTAEFLINHVRDSGGRTNLDISQSADMILAQYSQSPEIELPQLWLPGLLGEQALFSLYDFSALAPNRDPRKLNAADYMVREARAAGVLPQPIYTIAD